MGKMQREKGARGERYFANRLTSATEELHERMPTGVEAKHGNSEHSGGDIKCELPFSFQVKMSGNPPIAAAVREAEEAAGEHRFAVALTYKTRKGRKPEIRAHMPFEDWLKMYALLVKNDLV